MESIEKDTELGHYLVVTELSKSYQEGDKKRIVLVDTSFTIEKGGFTAIFGKSGSGKTTFLNLLSGIDLPDQGHIRLDGLELSSLSDHERTLFRRRYIGFVFQFYNLISTLTVWENVILPLELNGMANKAGFERACLLLQEVGLADRLKTFPDRLSGGEQQRVAIARALVHNPQLVLADEPTGNLDEERGLQIMGLLDRLTSAAGKSLILVTHSEESARFADRLYDLHDGKLALRK